MVIRDLKIDLIAKFADTVMFINPNNSDFDACMIPTGQYLRYEFDDGLHLLTRIKTELNILKTPYGPTGSIFLDFIPQHFRFESAEK